jgi:hypothetical protein
VELSQNAGDAPSVQTSLYIARRGADEMTVATTPQVQRSDTQGVWKTITFFFFLKYGCISILFDSDTD